MVNKMNKKGDYKYSVIFSLILGLMVLSLSLYFIFNEVWSSDAADREVCRQSIQLRSLLPNVELEGIDSGVSFKDKFPLKCKTKVVEINEGEVERGEVGKIIAEIIAECWALYDNGDANAFPTEFFKSGACVPCARIHLTDEAKAAMGDDGINIRESLNLQMSQGFSYHNYLMSSGDKFSAFDFGNVLHFNLSGDSFNVKGFNIFNTDVVNKINGETAYLGVIRDEISLPKILYPEKGDLLINYGVVAIGSNIVSGNKEFGGYIPYLFYFQTGQDPNPFEIVQHTFIANPVEAVFNILTVNHWEAIKDPEGELKKLFGSGVDFCEQWEGIPA